MKTVQLLCKACPEHMTKQTNRHGMTPLHLTCMSGTELGIFRFILMEFPEAVLVKNFYDQTPLEWSTAKVQDMHDQPASQLEEDLGVWRCKIELMLRCTAHLTLDTHGCRWQYAHLFAAVDCSPRIFPCVIDMGPVQAQVRDGRGTFFLRMKHVYLERSYSKLWPLLRVAPDIIRQQDQKTGLYPFQLAAASKKCDLTSVFEVLRASPELVQSDVGEGTRKERAVFRLFHVCKVPLLSLLRLLADLLSMAHLFRKKGFRMSCCHDHDVALSWSALYLCFAVLDNELSTCSCMELYLLWYVCIVRVLKHGHFLWSALFLSLFAMLENELPICPHMKLSLLWYVSAEHVLKLGHFLYRKQFRSAVFVNENTSE